MGQILLLRFFKGQRFVYWRKIPAGVDFFPRPISSKNNFAISPFKKYKQAPKSMWKKCGPINLLQSENCNDVCKCHSISLVYVVGLILGLVLLQSNMNRECSSSKLLVAFEMLQCLIHYILVKKGFYSIWLSNFPIS